LQRKSVSSGVKVQDGNPLTEKNVPAARKKEQEKKKCRQKERQGNRDGERGRRSGKNFCAAGRGGALIDHRPKGSLHRASGGRPVRQRSGVRERDSQETTGARPRGGVRKLQKKKGGTERKKKKRGGSISHMNKAMFAEKRGKG